MKIEKLELDIVNSGHITNSYLVCDENKEGILIDPADESEKIISKIKELELNIKYIILTHAHFDHTNALYDIKKYLNAKVLVHKNDFAMLMGKADDASSIFNAKPKYINEDEIEKIEDKCKFKVGNIEFEIMHTPGHTAGSIIIFLNNENILFTGDTLFENSFGRCDLATSNFNCMIKSLRKIFEKFDDSVIYPGHGNSSNIIKTKKYIKLLLALRNVNLEE